MGDAPAGQWFAIRHPRHTTYMQASEKGRFIPTPPDGVDLSSLPIIDVSGPAPTELHDYLVSLGKTIASADPTSGARIAAIAEATRRGNDVGAVREELMAIVQGFAFTSPEIADAAFASELENQTRHRFIDLHMPGTLVSTIYLLTRIVRVATPLNLVHQAFSAGGSLDIFDGAQVFARDVLARLVRVEGGEAKIDEAAAELQADAESFTDQTESATDFGKFYALIFESLPLAYAAQQGFEFLANADGAKAKQYRVLANVCDERVATAYATMGNDFCNSVDWRRLRGHRATITHVRETDGVAAAELLADQYTTRALLYPPFTRDFLLGKTDTLPLHT